LALEFDIVMKRLMLRPRK